MPKIKKKNIRRPPPAHGYWWLLFAGLWLVTATAAFAMRYDQTIMPGVRIGSVPVGGLTTAAAAQRVADTLARQEVILADGVDTWTATWSQLGVKFDLVPSLDEAYRLGRDAPLRQWWQHMFLRRPLALNYSWSNDTLTAYLLQVADAIGDLPREPRVSYVDGQFQVSPEQAGIMIDDQALQEQLRPAVTHGRPAAVTLQPTVHWPPAVQQDFSTVVAQAGQLLSLPLTISAADQTREVDNTTRASWLEFRVSGEHQVELTVNQAAVGAWVIDLAKTVNIDAVPRQVLASTHRTDEIASGKDGRAINVSAATAQLAAALLGGATTISLPVETVLASTAYADVPAVSINTGKVISVDLTKQHEYLYEDGVLVYHTKISSGINDWTPTGTFHVYAKTKKQKMSGPDYYVPNVPNILWFKGDYSIHGVYWHNDFGIRPRSHGCVGEPLDAAAWVYDWTPVGTPVVIYKS